MSHRIIVDAEADGQAVDLLTPHIPAYFRTADPGENADLWIQGRAASEHVVLRPIVAPDAFFDRLARKLAGVHSRVQHFTFHVVGDHPAKIRSSETFWKDGESEFRDTSVDTRSAVREAGYRVRDEVERDETIHAMLEVIVEATVPDYMALETHDFEVRYMLTVSSRVLTLVHLLDAGATWEWVELYGQKAIKVTGDGESQISVLKPEEVAELEEWLAAR